MKYLDITGLNKFWNKIKSLLNGKIDKIENGKSSQFLKADGSVDNTLYFPKSGGIITGSSYIPFSVNTTYEDHVAATLSVNGEQKTSVEWMDGKGSYIYNYASDKRMGISDNGIPNFNDKRIWHEGNDGADSGLDADMLDGKQGELYFSYLYTNSYDSIDLNTYNKLGMCRIRTPELPTENSPFEGYGVLLNFKCNNYSAKMQFVSSNLSKLYFRSIDSDANLSKPWKQIAFTDSNVASANMVTVETITEGDLNDIKSREFKLYYLGEGVITNKPPGVYNGYLQVFGINNSTYCVQICLSLNGTMYKRSYVNKVWSDWVKITDITDNAAALTSKQLTDEDLNNLKDPTFNSYYANQDNTCANKPTNVTSFGLITIPWGNYKSGQCLFLFFQLTIYTRLYNGSTWSDWVKLATKNDLNNLLTSALTDEDLDTVVPNGNFKLYSATYGNTCINTPASFTTKTAFRLFVYGGSNLYGTQICEKVDTINMIYKRICVNGTWGPWTKILTENDIENLVNKVEELTERINSLENNNK